MSSIKFKITFIEEVTVEEEESESDDENDDYVSYVPSKKKSRRNVMIQINANNSNRSYRTSNMDYGSSRKR